MSVSTIFGKLSNKGVEWDEKKFCNVIKCCSDKTSVGTIIAD